MQVSISIIRDIIYAAVYSGASLQDICREVSIRPEALQESEQQYDLSKAGAVWQASVRHSGDPLLGLHTGAQVNFEAIGVVGFVMQNSPDVQTALERGAHYSNLYSNLLEISLGKKGDWTRARFTPRSIFLQQYPEAARQATESSMAFVAEAVRKLSNRRLDAGSVSFTFAGPPVEWLPTYEKIFRSPLVFREEENVMVFASDELQAPVISYNAALFRLLDDEAARLLRDYQHETLLKEKVKRVLIPLLKSHHPGVEEVSQELNVSARTLQRKLKEEDTTYQAILEELQKDLALGYLRENHLSIAEVAYLLGYSEPGVFTRAFKRWTGYSPSEFREGLQHFR